MSKLRDYLFVCEDRKFFAVRRRAKDMMAWEGRGNPLLWFSWEELPSGERIDLACGVKTLREAQEPCGITS